MKPNLYLEEAMVTLFALEQFMEEEEKILASLKELEKRQAAEGIERARTQAEIEYSAQNIKAAQRAAEIIREAGSRAIK